MLRSAAWILALLSAMPLSPSRKGDAPSPEAFFGFPLGAERQLPTWDQTVAYLR
jgi:hypothetical protein